MALFFIPRSFAGASDNLSAVVFGEYIKALLDRGHSIECFIEGGRSRTGKVLQPKVGMLYRAVDWVLEEARHNLFVVPISLTYDRIVENDSHLEELSGAEKKAEKFASSIRGISGVIASSVMNVRCYGRVDLRVAEPFDLKEYIAMSLVKMKDSTRHHNLTENKKRKHLALSVGYQSLYLCNKVSVAEPAAMVATILLTHCKRGITRSQLRKDTIWLRDLIVAHGGKVISLRPEYIDVVLTLILGPIVGKNQLVKQHKELLMVDLYSPKERMELSLYQNQIIHHFVQAGIMSLALYKHDKECKVRPMDIDRHAAGVKVKDLFGDVKFLSSLLKFEFIFPTTSNLEQNIRTNDPISCRS